MPPRVTWQDRWSGAIAGAGLIALTCLVYLPVWHASAIWDDNLYVFQNPHVQAPGGLSAIWRPFVQVDYYPVTSSLFWATWQIWGPDYRVYHALGVLLHALSALVAWRVLCRLAVPGALVAAAVFAVHPVAVDAVAWISETKTTLSFLLFGLALGAHLRFEDSGRPAWYALALLSFLLALLAKASVVMLPCVLLILAWWRRGKIVQADVRRSLPFFALSLVLGLLTVAQDRTMMLDTGDVRPEGLPSRLAASGWGLVFYATKVLAPVRLSMIYPRWDVDPGWLPAWLPLLGVAGLLAVAWRRRSGWGGPVFLALAFFGTMLAPVLGLVSFGFLRFSLVADHLQYPAMVAPIALLVAAATRWMQRRRWGPWPRGAAALALLLPLSLLTVERVGAYRDSASLWTDVLEKNPSAWIAHHMLALELQASGRVEGAISHFQRAVELHPEGPRHRILLGNLLWLEGRQEEALAHLRRALEIDPDLPQVHQSLGQALHSRGDLDAAIRHYRRALELHPGSTQTRARLDSALAEVARRR